MAQSESGGRARIGDVAGWGEREVCFFCEGVAGLTGFGRNRSFVSGWQVGPCGSGRQRLRGEFSVSRNFGWVSL
jgi:hypothetical protein